jgi:hypothetical protein
MLHALLFEHRVGLLKAWLKADTSGSGRILVGIWSSAARPVMGLAFTLLSLKRQLLFPPILDEKSGTVDYRAFIHAFKLALPSASPLFRHRHHLLALCHKVDDDASGVVTVSEFGACCVALKNHLCVPSFKPRSHLMIFGQ